MGCTMEIREDHKSFRQSRILSLSAIKDLKFVV